MNKVSFSFSIIKSIVLCAIIFLFPFFFLPVTQEFFVTAKTYFLAFGVLLLFLISTIELIVTKKFNWEKSPFDNLLVLFVITIGLSIVISSPNKIQALINPNFGLVSMISLVILVFYLSRSKMKQFINLAIVASGILLAVISIFFFFTPFGGVSLPPSMLFLKNPFFTPIGNQLDLAIFLGFFVVYGLTQIINHKKQSNNETMKQSLILNSSFLILSFIALSLTIYSLFKPSTDVINHVSTLSTLPPFRLSWYAVLEILKNPLTALFGTGIDNFSAVFTKVKDVAYNQTNLWQVSSFSVSRSALLHIFTEAGIFGFVSFALLIFVLIKQTLSHPIANRYYLIAIVYWLLMALLFPPSLPLFFLFFLILSQTSNIKDLTSSFDLSNLLPFYLGTVIISLVIIGASSYLLATTYYAEVLYKKSLDAFATNQVQNLYNDMRQAVILNPFVEKYRTNFSQVNLLIANNVAVKANDKYKLTDQDRQIISQAIQAAIAEAKAGVTLNSQKAGNWENLAYIYRNIINVAQGADGWTVAAYQRAIALDPQNPTYRLNLGGIYYSFNNFDTASSLFEQASTIKPDWANAHYNLAWGNYMKQNYQVAAAEMQNVLYLLDPKKDKTDYDKAANDLEEFKKKLPETQQTKQETKQNPQQLTLPTPPKEKVEPPIQLPKEASPEAR